MSIEITPGWVPYVSDNKSLGDDAPLRLLRVVASIKITEEGRKARDELYAQLNDNVRDKICKDDPDFIEYRKAMTVVVPVVFTHHIQDVDKQWLSSFKDGLAVSRIDEDNWAPKRIRVDSDGMERHITSLVAPRFKNLIMVDYEGTVRTFVHAELESDEDTVEHLMTDYPKDEQQQAAYEGEI
jgi:hypothetical protein